MAKATAYLIGQEFILEGDPRICRLSPELLKQYPMVSTVNNQDGGQLQFVYNKGKQKTIIKPAATYSDYIKLNDDAPLIPISILSAMPSISFGLNSTDISPSLFHKLWTAQCLFKKNWQFLSDEQGAADSLTILSQAHHIHNELLQWIFGLADIKLRKKAISVIYTLAQDNLLNATNPCHSDKITRHSLLAISQSCLASTVETLALLAQEQKLHSYNLALIFKANTLEKSVKLNQISQFLFDRNILNDSNLTSIIEHGLAAELCQIIDEQLSDKTFKSVKNSHQQLSSPRHVRQLNRNGLDNSYIIYLINKTTNPIHYAEQLISCKQNYPAAQFQQLISVIIELDGLDLFETYFDKLIGQDFLIPFLYQLKDKNLFNHKNLLLIFNAPNSQSLATIGTILLKRDNLTTEVIEKINAVFTVLSAANTTNDYCHILVQIIALRADDLKTQSLLMLLDSPALFDYLDIMQHFFNANFTASEVLLFLDNISQYQEYAFLLSLLKKYQCHNEQCFSLTMQAPLISLYSLAATLESKQLLNKTTLISLLHHQQLTTLSVITDLLFDNDLLNEATFNFVLKQDLTQLLKVMTWLNSEPNGVKDNFYRLLLIHDLKPLLALLEQYQPSEPKQDFFEQAFQRIYPDKPPAINDSSTTSHVSYAAIIKQLLEKLELNAPEQKLDIDKAELSEANNPKSISLRRLRTLTPFITFRQRHDQGSFFQPEKREESEPKSTHYEGIVTKI